MKRKPPPSSKFDHLPTQQAILAMVTEIYNKLPREDVEIDPRMEGARICMVCKRYPERCICNE